ncbi:SGNH/GDSL hydrolase family protein [Tenggerimyces flavus]|uniref:SGNH/GDSL hydrolase family protein n=1 Tax=Tenggerimyces flavus TaxID=1708749 RepID=A0ABV7Y7G3_9ACTN|nr:SGNH/GDSL hydrolase family protein [Tenggerimyces flavus]MBM7788379.1 lysophospholipase L1-like esterase [Tenggerimyces flavus]
MRIRVALVALSTTVGLLAAPAVAQADEPVEYVALGDSYAAGSGVLPIVKNRNPLCLQSSRNYPHVLAASIGANLDDRTCGGAATNDFNEAQYPGTPAQLNAVDEATDLITISIGGNDGGLFGTAIQECALAGLSTGGFGNPCERKYGSKYLDIIDTIVYPNVKQALQLTKDKGPNARIVVVGYPWIMPATRGCFPLMPVARGDVPYVRALQARLHDRIAQASSEEGVEYVDLEQASEGKDTCGSIKTRWVEPVLGGTNPVIVHPNARGEAGMAAVVQATL